MVGAGLPTPVRRGADEICQTLFAHGQLPEGRCFRSCIADDAEHPLDLTVRIELRLAVHDAIEQTAIRLDQFRFHRKRPALRPARGVVSLQNRVAVGEVMVTSRRERNGIVGRVGIVERREFSRHPEIGCGGAVRLPIRSARHPHRATQRPLLMPPPRFSWVRLPQ